MNKISAYFVKYIGNYDNRLREIAHIFLKFRLIYLEMCDMTNNFLKQSSNFAKIEAANRVTSANL